MKVTETITAGLGAMPISDSAQLVLQFNDFYLSMQEGDEGYDYSIYDLDYNLVDGGVYDDFDISVSDVLSEIVEEYSEVPLEDRTDVRIIDYEEFMDEIELREGLCKMEEATEQLQNQNRLGRELLENLQKNSLELKQVEKKQKM